MGYARSKLAPNATIPYRRGLPGRGTGCQVKHALGWQLASNNAPSTADSKT